MQNEITKEHIKEIKRLHDSRERTEKRLFLVEGIRFMEEAIKEKVALVEALYTAKLEESQRGRVLLASLNRFRVPLFRVPDKTMEAMAETEHPQGVLAVARQFDTTLNDVIGENRHVIVACGLQDPGNLGTIIRTADAGGFGGILTTPDSVEFYNSKVVRSTMGSIFRLPVVRVNDPEKAINAMKKEGYQVVATSLKADSSYLDISYSTPTAFLIGRESSGLSAEMQQLADKKVYIPMKEGVESLNAAVSATILIYEAFRQKRP